MIRLTAYAIIKLLQFGCLADLATVIVRLDWQESCHDLRQEPEITTILCAMVTFNVTVHLMPRAKARPA